MITLQIYKIKIENQYNCIGNLIKSYVFYEKLTFLNNFLMKLTIFYNKIFIYNVMYKKLIEL